MHTVITFQPAGTLGKIQEIIFLPPKLQQLGGRGISNIASFAYLFLLLLPFVIRPFAQLFHITANYQPGDSLVAQGSLRLWFF